MGKEEVIKLLLVEDDENLLYIEKMTFEDIIGDYEVKTAVNGKEGLEVWKEFRPDVIVSDMDMPIMGGMEMVRRIRETDGDVIILFATAMTSPADVKKGYKAGANNYVKKPFVPEELNEHIRSMMLLRKGGKFRDETNFLTIGNFLFDPDHRILTDKAIGHRRVLTRRESSILQLLAENMGDVVSRDAIISRCWGVEERNYFNSRSLDVFVVKLRKYLSTDDMVELNTVRGVGLQLKTD